jgi:hypothetical protein
LFQLNATVTAFFGGVGRPESIVTHDWSSMQYTEHAAKLSDHRQLCAAAVVRGERGENLVPIS